MTKVKLRDVKKGDLIVVDGSLRCVPEGMMYVYKSSRTDRRIVNKLYVLCRHGFHYLANHPVDEEGYLKGVVGLISGSSIPS